MSGISAWQRARRAIPDLATPTSRWWAGLPTWGRWVVYVLVAIGAILLPAPAVGSFLAPESVWEAILFNPIGLYVLLAIGLNVVVGQAGLLDLGYVAFYAIGGYAMGLFGTKAGMNFWEILPIAIAISVVAGLLLGAPTLRLRGDYLAIVTLGFGEIIRITANNLEFTGGPRGIAGIPHPPSVPGIYLFGVEYLNYENLLDTRAYYYLLLCFIVIAIIMVKRLERSRVGRAWAAIREDEDAAEVMGVPTFKYKLLAFAIGAAIGGTAGVLLAAQRISITPEDFPFITSALILAAVVLGGSGNIVGVIVSAFLVAWLPEISRDFQQYRVLVFGAALVLLMALRPEGLIPSRRRRAELAEGTGGMGSLGGEVGGATTQNVEAELATAPVGDVRLEADILDTGLDTRADGPGEQR